MQQLLGDAAALTVAVGNYENDIDIIQAADIGYAVSNAIPSVKAVADHITVSDAEHAIQESLPISKRIVAFCFKRTMQKR